MGKDENISRSGRLLEGIVEQAQQESKKILADAEQQAKEIVEGARRKSDTIREEAEERLEKQVEVIRRKYRQLTETEQRRIRLQAQEEIFSMTLERVRDGLTALRKKPDYPDILKNWIVEGALGLGRDRLHVNGSEHERSLLDSKLLKECEREIAGKNGRQVGLELSPDPPTGGQGVFLSTTDGRLAFNNLVEARLQRYSAGIRRMIYRRIQSEQMESE